MKRLTTVTVLALTVSAASTALAQSQIDFYRGSDTYRLPPRERSAYPPAAMGARDRMIQDQRLLEGRQVAPIAPPAVSPAEQYVIQRQSQN